MEKRGALIIAQILFCLLVMTPVLPAAPAEVWVSGNDGLDTNDGLSSTSPVKSLTRAQLIARTLIQDQMGVSGGGGVTVQIRGGLYASTSFSKSALLALTPQDSGLSENQRITWQAYENEDVLLSGGQLIDPLLFRPVPLTKATPLGPLSSSVLQVNLTEALGSKWANANFYGNLGTGSLGTCTNKNRMELFFNGKPAILARFPNINATTGAFNFLGIKNVNTTTLSFTSSSKLSAERQAAWKAETNPWLHGYWFYNWADNYCKLKKVNDSLIFIDPTTPPVYGLTSVGSRFYAVNMLCELDAPGEYYVDVTSNMLYFYPPSSIKPNSQIIVSMSSYVVTLASKTNYVTFKNLRIGYAQSVNFQTSNPVSSIQVIDCDLSNVGGSNLYISGTNNLVQGSVMNYAGCSANGITGGDLTTLAPGLNKAINNTVMRYARFNRVYLPAFSFSGAGNSFVGNEIAFAPHQALSGSGNDHIFENNYVHDVVQEAADSGAWYMGRNWAWRGNVIRGNTFENIIRFAPGYAVSAVYFDDELSGNYVLNNNFINCDVGVEVGGGKDVVVTGNYFYNMIEYAVTLDNRGMNWQHADCIPGAKLEKSLLNVNYLTNTAYWKYPHILDTMNNSCVPSRNIIENNTYCGFTKFLSATSDQVKAWGSTARRNILQCPPTPSPTISSVPTISPTRLPTVAPTPSPSLTQLKPTLSPTQLPTRSGDTQLTLVGSLTFENISATALLGDPHFPSAFSLATTAALTVVTVVPSIVSITSITATKSPTMIAFKRTTKWSQEEEERERFLTYTILLDGATIKYSIVVSMQLNSGYSTATTLSAAVSSGLATACSTGDFLNVLRAADPSAIIDSISAATNVSTVSIESVTTSPASGSSSSSKPPMKQLAGAGLYAVVAIVSIVGILVVVLLCRRYCNGGKVGLLPAGGSKSDYPRASEMVVQATNPSFADGNKQNVNKTPGGKMFYNPHTSPTAKSPEIRPSIFGSDEIYSQHNQGFGIDRLSVDR